MPKMTPSEAMAEVLVQEGVNHMSGILGSAFMDLLDLIKIEFTRKYDAIGKLCKEFHRFIV